MDVLLVGEEVRFLRLLSLEFAFRGFKVAMVSEPDEMKAAIDLLAPDIVILDHVEPLDLFALNPRTYGYEGPVIILATTDIPAASLEGLNTPHHLKKPFHFPDLCEQIELVATASRCATR